MGSKKSGRKTFTTAERKALSIRMKAWHAKKKNNLNQKKFDFKPAKNMIDSPVSYAEATMKPQEPFQTKPAWDAQRAMEFNYRRGLVTAMECILRELR